MAKALFGSEWGTKTEQGPISRSICCTFVPDKVARLTNANTLRFDVFNFSLLYGLGVDGCRVFEAYTQKSQRVRTNVNPVTFVLSPPPPERIEWMFGKMGFVDVIQSFLSSLLERARAGGRFYDPQKKRNATFSFSHFVRNKESARTMGKSSGFILTSSTYCSSFTISFSLSLSLSSEDRALCVIHWLYGVLFFGKST
jgi:hypothetical protein